MGAMQGAMAVLGVGLHIGGSAMEADAADKKIRDYEAFMNDWMPDIPAYQDTFFKNLFKYEDEASDLARIFGEKEMATALDRREQAIPGSREGVRRASEAIFPLLRGELPQGVLDAYSRAGGASAMAGMGSGSNFLMQGIFGARGALDGMQLGGGLLGSLMSTIPNVRIPTGMDFLSAGVLTPAQQTNTALQLRQQNIAMATHLVGMKNSDEVWAGSMKDAGAVLIGGAMGGDASSMGGIGGGMGGGGGSPYGNETQGYMGSSGGAAYYNVPTTTGYGG